MMYANPRHHQSAVHTFHVPHKDEGPQLISHLRNENQLLKMQLQRLMQRTNPQKDSANLLSRTEESANKQEVQIESVYKRKIENIKTRKLSKKSIEHTQTASNSLSKSKQLKSPNQPQHNNCKIPRLILADPRSKVMALSKDKNGRYFRDREEEQKVTVRKSQLLRQLNNLPGSAFPITQANSKQHSIHTVPRSFGKISTQSTNQPDKHKIRTNINSPISKLQHKNHEYNQNRIQGFDNKTQASYFVKRNQQKITTSKQYQPIQKMKNVVKQRQPRGNFYLMSEQQSRANSIHNSKGDEDFSSPRQPLCKLKYNIYMQDQL